MQDAVVTSVADEFHLTPQQVTDLFDLFEKGYTVPYLVHYRKDLVGALCYDDLRALQERKRDLRKLDKRKREVGKKLRERELLTPELEQLVGQASSLRAVNDIFLPYRPKKHSRSVDAMALGLEPLARRILTQEGGKVAPGEAAKELVDPAKGLPDVATVLKNCGYIICDWIAEERTLRDNQRDILRKQGKVAVRQAKDSIPERLSKEFKDYFNYDERLQSLHPYRMLIILRGARVKALEYSIVAPIAAMREAAAEMYLEGGKEALRQVAQARETGPLPEILAVPMKIDRPRGDGAGAEEPEAVATAEFPAVADAASLQEFLTVCIEWSLEHILIPVLVRELDRELNDKAELHALALFKRNLRSILMQQPLPPARVMALAPGYRMGCKLAVLDEKGNHLDHAVVFPHTPQNEVEQAKTKIEELVAAHGVKVLAIGDGTACRETEALVSGLIQEKLPEVQYTIVSETGLQAYVTSKQAKQELSGVQQPIKAAISIGRRLLNPIGELVKLDPKVLCSSPYLQNVSARRLKDALTYVIEECVCEVGAELNEAELNMLRNIAGLNGNRARSIIAKRAQTGPFTARDQLMQVEGMDDKVYLQCAGFLRIENAANWLDRTRIHPDHYAVAQKLCEDLQIDPTKLGTPEEKEKIENLRKQLNLTALEAKHGAHYLTIRDIVAELADPWSDPRKNWSGPVLRKSQLKLEEIQAGQTLRGIVRNIVDFGVFVDVGVSEDGLIHVSELSDGYVHSPYEVVSVGDIIQVRVIKVDTTANRIALSLRKSSDRAKGRPRPSHRPPRADGQAPRERPPAGAREDRGGDRSQKAGQAQTAQSTLGARSRRFQKASLDGPPAKPESPAAPTGPRPQQVKRPKPRERSPEEKPQNVEGLINLVQFGKLEKRGHDKEGK